jgi:TIGR03009 family protein
MALVGCKKWVVLFGGAQIIGMRDSRVKIVGRDDDSMAGPPFFPASGLVRFAAGSYSSRPFISRPSAKRVTRMNQITRSVRAALSFCLAAVLTNSIAIGQQLGPPQAYPQQQAYSQQAPAPQAQQPQTAQPQAAAPAPGPVAPQMPPGFPLNPLQQAAVDQALNAWQTQSGKIITFSCPFDRLEYVRAFGPIINGQSAPLNKNKGQLSYSKPDKGSFQIDKIYTYKELPPAAGDQAGAPRRGDWALQPNAIGEHWVCDGKSVYEFRSDQKQVIERPLPPRAPGESIIDGPLPFLFGAESEKLKQRYWIRIDERNGDPNQIWLNAWPKFQEQAANFRQVDVILDRQLQLPAAMRVTLPNGDQHVYAFEIKKANINGALQRLQNALFERPRTPLGWKHVVENVPVAQAPDQQAPQTR